MRDGLFARAFREGFLASRYSRVNTQAGALSLVVSRLFQTPGRQRGRVRCPDMPTNRPIGLTSGYCLARPASTDLLQRQKHSWPLVLFAYHFTVVSTGVQHLLVLPCIVHANENSPVLR